MPPAQVGSRRLTVDFFSHNHRISTQFAVRGREIYLQCPNGYGRTKLTNGYFDSKLATTSTVRNWRTVVKLLELAGG